MNKKMKKTRIPQQERSIEKKKRIIDTAIKLFSKFDYDDIGPAEIAAKSGVSVGTFYSYFKKKSDLLLDIITKTKKQSVDEILKRTEEIAQTSKDPRSVLYFFIQEHFNTPALPPLLRRRTAAMRFTDREVEAFHAQEEKITLALTKQLFTILHDEITVKDRDLAAKIVLITLKEFSLSYSIFKRSIPKEKLVQELTDMILLYLFKK